VYEGVEKFLIPKSLSPEAYRSAIAEDRQMTADVAGGKMTRSERRERVQKLIEEIHRIEEANSAKLQQQALDRTWKEEMQRRQDMVQHMFVPLTR
jgi:polyhydroxyalkanoate synthesis regulator phasin